ncbi:MAG: 3'-5' exonuclease [bacterium]
MDGWLAVVDTETTGFDPVQHEVIDTHVLLVDPQLNVRYEAGGRSPLLYPEKASPQALKVNGYSLAEWEKTQRPLGEVLYPCFQLIELAECWLGSNPSFDVRFLIAAGQSIGLRLPHAKRLTDTKDVAAAMGVYGVSEKGYRSQSLGALARHFGILLGGMHGARVDCYVTLEVYKRLTMGANR